MPIVTSTELFKKAYDGGYAIGAFNINNMEIVQGITDAAAEMHSPVILQASQGARKYANSVYLVKLVEAASELHPEVPMVLHLDHGADFDVCKDCVDHGFTSVMIDYSGHPFEENIAESKKVAEYAHDHGVVVEADKAFYTDPDQVEEFVKRTGVDSLAIAIGTSHGAYKFKPGTKPQLRLDILAEVARRLPGFPIVLHGSSSVPQEYVKIINANGGKLVDAIGVPEDQLREAAKGAVCKINIDSDLRLGMTAGIRQHFNEHPEHFDPRQYLGDGRANVKAIVEHKIKDVLGSDNKI